MAHLTLADNIHEGVNAQDEDCWYCDLYTLVLPDNDNMAKRLEKSYEKFLEKAKEVDAEMSIRKPTVEERIEAQVIYTALMTDTLLIEEE